METLTPHQTVAELDRYIVGQKSAKRAIAVALRNRYRRQLLPDGIRDEVAPKNILMIGPTGVGKTEIARRVAKMLDAPFIKVEATKFTEVGYVGRDVESIVRELLENAINLLHDQKVQDVREQAEGRATEKILDYLCPAGGGDDEQQGDSKVVSMSKRPSRAARQRRQRKKYAEMLRNNQLEEQMIEIDVDSENEAWGSVFEFVSGMTPEEMTESFQDFVDSWRSSSRKRSRRVSIKEARRILTQEEAHKLIDFDAVVEEAVQRCEQLGVVFIDELDKIVGSNMDIGNDVSGEGVQRDLLPIVEGSVVMTRYGPLRTDHILFVAAGSFHKNKPSDLIPELQGRFPLRVEMQSLGEAELKEILVRPDNSLTKQYQALLATEGVELTFTEDGIAELARIANEMNTRLENIGARRLHTIMEQVLEEVSFDASERQGESVMIDRGFVAHRMKTFMQSEDLQRYIL